MRRILTLVLVALVACAAMLAATSAVAAWGWPTWSINKVLGFAETDAAEPFIAMDADVNGVGSACYTWRPSALSTGTVVAYDLTDDESQTVKVDGVTQDQQSAQIEADTLLIAEQRDDQWGLYLYNISDDPISSDLVTETAGPAEIDLNGSLFAYAGVPNGAHIVSTPFTLGPPTSPPKESKVEDFAVETRVIFGYTDEPGDLTVLPGPDGAAQFEPSVSGDYVAFREIDTNTAPDTYRVKVQSLDDPTDVTVVASGTAEVGYPSLDSDLVAWLEWDTDHWSPRAWDLSADEEIVMPDYECSNVKADGTKVAMSLVGEDASLDIYDTQLEVLAEGDYADVMEQFAAANGQSIYKFGWNGNNRSGLNVAYWAAPDIYTEAPDFVGYNGRPFISGWVADQGIALAIGDVELQSSTDGLRWTTEDTATPDGDGDYFLNGDPLTDAKLYRVRYLGSSYSAFPIQPQHLSAVGDTQVVVAKPKVGTPSAPSSRIKRYRRFTSSGTISPSQVGEQAAGRIEIYRKVHGTWKLYGRIGTSFSGGTYRASLKFSNTGQFRYRMHFLGSDSNYPTFSSWRYVTVYQ